MPLGQGMTQMVQAVQDRIEVSEGDGVWHVTAGSFESALAYARERFGQPTVLARRDRGRWWPRVTLTVTTDAHRAAQAPPLEELAQPSVPEQRSSSAPVSDDTPPVSDDAPPAAEPDAAADRGPLPPSLEAIFSRQDPR